MFKKASAASFSLMAILASFLMIGAGCRGSDPSSIPGANKSINIGYFANVNHAPVMVGLAKGTFQRELGQGVEVKTKVFNAGPAVMEALFAGAIDVAYIGPTPAINGYARSEGKALRIISGVTSGGASLVLQPALAEEFARLGPPALKGKTIATPQQGNTQNVALRHYVREQGMTGQVTIRPMANADQLPAFRQKQIDGAWAPEPWATRLVLEVDGKRALDERDRWPEGKFPSAVIVVRQEFLNERPELVKAWLLANAETIVWMNTNTQDAKNVFNTELKKVTSVALPENILDESWSRLLFSTAPLQAQTKEQANWAREEGYLEADLSIINNAYDLTLLNEIERATNQ